MSSGGTNKKTNTNTAAKTNTKTTPVSKQPAAAKGAGAKSTPAKPTKPQNTKRQPSGKENKKKSNGFISGSDDDEETKSRKSGRGKSADKERARQKMNEMENNIRNNDADFQEEYEDFKTRSSDGLALLTDAIKILDDQAQSLEATSTEDMLLDLQYFQSLRDEVSSTRRLLLGSEKYLRLDFLENLLKLQNSIKRCVDILNKRIKEMNITFTTIGKVKGVIWIDPRVLDDLAAVAVELKELQEKVLGIIETSQMIADELAKTSAEIQVLEDLAITGQEQAEINKTENTEPEKTEDEDKHDEQEQEENKEDEEEEQRQREREEEEERERLRREEEMEVERRRQEEERRKAEEERLRLEREREEMLKRMDPKNFPSIMYDLNEDEDKTGSGVGCVMRVPPDSNLVQENLTVTSLDMVENRFIPDDNEELVSNIISIVPAEKQDINVEIPLWIAIPCSGVVRGKEFSIRVQQISNPLSRPGSARPGSAVSRPRSARSARELMSAAEREQVKNSVSAYNEDVQAVAETGSGAEQQNQEAAASKDGAEEAGADSTKPEINGEEEKNEQSESNEETEKKSTQDEDQKSIKGEDTKSEKNEDKKSIKAGDQTDDNVDETKSVKSMKVNSEGQGEIEQPDGRERREGMREEGVRDEGVRGVVVKKEGENPWEEVLTRETTIEGKEVVKFVETQFSKIPAYGIKVVVIIRPKKEVEKFNNKGGKLIYSVDPRNSITVPKNAFRLATEVTLQVIPVDTTSLNSLKERNEGCETLIGSTPFLNVGLSVKPSKPLAFTVTNPGGASKPKRVNNGPGGKSFLPGTSKTKLSEDTSTNEVDILNLMLKDNKGKWKHCENAEITFAKEFTSFEVSEILERLVVLRTNSVMDSNDLCKLCTKLETAVVERSVSVVVRQLTAEPETIIFDLVKSENVDRVCQRLNDDGFLDGPEENEKISLREGDIIEVKFRENINFEDKTVRKIVFNSNVPSGKFQTKIGVVSEFAQNALENYQGFVQLSLIGRDYKAETKVLRYLRKPKNAGAGFMCEILLTLPKPIKDVSRVNKAEFRVPTEGPISEEYINYLSRELGEEWVDVASALGHTLASKQRIQQTYAFLSGTAEGQRTCIKTMLVDWFKASKQSKTKVEDLYNALIEGRRKDLADALRQKDTELREESLRLAKEELLEKCSRAYGESRSALKTWRPVAKALGLSSEDIGNIGGAPLVQEISADKVREMLSKWQERQGEAATRDSLVVVLKRLKLNEAATLVEAL